MTVRQRTFVHALLASPTFDQTAAAKEAGYANPSITASRLLKSKIVRAIIGKELRLREERSHLKADDVLEYLRHGLFFNPLSLFRPSKDGKWLVKSLDEIPEEIGRLIEKIKTKVVTKPDGATESFFEIELISNATLLPLAMKHLGISGAEKHEMLGKLQFDFDALCGRGEPIDVVSKAIEEV